MREFFQSDIHFLFSLLQLSDFFFQVALRKMSRVRKIISLSLQHHKKTELLRSCVDLYVQ